MNNALRKLKGSSLAIVVNTFLFLFVLGGLAQAQVTDAASLASSLTSGISDVGPTMWTIGGIVAGIVAITLTIGMMLRGGKAVGKSA